MGMSTHIEVYVERDEKYRQMAKILKECQKAEITAPLEVLKYLGVKKYDVVDPERGESVDISSFDGICDGVEAESADVWEIDLVALLAKYPNAKTIRVGNHY